MKQIFTQALSFFCAFFLACIMSSGTVFAAAYGECGYGEGAYGTGCSGTNTSSNTSTAGNPSAPVCTDQAPGTKVPWLYAAVPKDGNSVLLYFTEADDPVDRYVLEFGTKSGNYPWGSTNIGGKGTRTYLVQYLLPNTEYFFRVRGGNGCATGNWSNEISVRTKKLVSQRQLSFDQFELTRVEEEREASIEGELDSKTGYSLNLKVVDKNQQPVSGAKVTIHSEVQEGFTDENGSVRFENLEPGQHRVIVNYKDYEGEQAINLTGDAEEYAVTIVIERKNVLTSPLVIGIIATLTGIIVFLLALLGKQKLRRSP